MNRNYIEMLSRILADTGFVITIVGPDGPILGTKADILAIDDMPGMDRAALKDATFGLTYYGEMPIQDIDFSKLEERVLALWEESDEFFVMDSYSQLSRTRRNGKTDTLHDYRVIKRKRVVQEKQWETKAAIKSRQLRNRQKG